MYMIPLISASSAEFVLTDYCTDIPYTVGIYDDVVSIHSENLNVDLPIDKPVISSCIHRNKFYFLTYTEYNSDYHAAFYIYDKNSGTLIYNLTNLHVYTDETRFTVDNEEKLYLVDRYDNSLINCYKQGTIKTFNLNSTVTQIMCLDGEHITAITTKGIYLITDLELIKISDAPPVAPCVYTANGFVTDSTGTKYTYESGKLISYIPETSTAETDVSEYENIVINDDYIITFQGTTVAKLYKTLGLSKEDLRVYKKDGSVYTQGKVGTGMKAVIENKTFNIVILGELTGEGNINSRDLKIIMKFLTDEEVPDPVQKLSADINRDGTINTKDLLALSKLY